MQQLRPAAAPAPSAAKQYLDLGQAQAQTAPAQAQQPSQLEALNKYVLNMPKQPAAQPQPVPQSSNNPANGGILSFLLGKSTKVAQDIGAGLSGLLNGGQNQKQSDSMFKQASQFEDAASKETNPDKKKALLKNAQDIYTQISGGAKATAQNFSKDVEQNPLTRGAQAATEVGSYLVPFGQGKGILQKAIVPGAATGVLQSLSQDNASPETAIEGALTGGALGAAFHGLSKIPGLFGKTGGAIESAGNTLRKDVSKVRVPASIYGAGREEAVNKTLNELKITGNAQQQYQKLQGASENLYKGIAEEFANNPKSVPIDSVKEDLYKNLSQDRSLSLYGKKAKAAVDTVVRSLYEGSDGKAVVPKDISTENLFTLKQEINKGYGTIKTKLRNGTPLQDNEKVLYAARQTIDDLVAAAHPDIKKATTQYSHLIDAADSLDVARDANHSMSVMGTDVPSGVVQGGKDYLGRMLQAAGNTVSLPGKLQTGSDLGAVISRGAVKNGSGVLNNILFGAGQPGNVGNQEEAPNNTLNNEIGQNYGQSDLNHGSIISPTGTGVKSEEPQRIITLQKLAQASTDPNVSASDYTQLKQIYDLQEAQIKDSKGTKKDKNEQDIARQDTASLIRDALQQSGNAKVQFGPAAKVQNLLGNLNIGDQDTLNFNTTLANIQATIAKARAGTSFTPNEQKLLDQYTPKVGDSKQQIRTKLNNLDKIFGKYAEEN